MTRTVLLLLFIAAVPRLSAQGAATPSAAIDQFLAAARTKDLSAMSAVWGTAKGPASKSMDPKELERREFIMLTCLAHEKATVRESSPGEGGRLRYVVELALAARSASPAFTVVRGPRQRWFVENFDIEHLRDRGFCGASVPPSTPPR